MVTKAEGFADSTTSRRALSPTFTATCASSSDDAASFARWVEEVFVDTDEEGATLPAAPASAISFSTAISSGEYLRTSDSETPSLPLLIGTTSMLRYFCRSLQVTNTALTSPAGCCELLVVTSQGVLP